MITQCICTCAVYSTHRNNKDYQKEFTDINVNLLNKNMSTGTFKKKLVKMLLEVKRMSVNCPTRRGLAKATRYRPQSTLTFQRVKKTKVIDIDNNVEAEQNSPLGVGVYWKLNLYFTDRIGRNRLLGPLPCMRVYHLVSRGQTTVFAQGRYRFQYKRPPRKRVWYTSSCVSHPVEYWVLIVKHRCIYILLQVMQYMHDEIRKL